MTKQVLTKILSNGYKVISETVRGNLSGNPKNEIKTIINVFDEAGNLIVKRDKTVLKNMFGDVIDYCSGKVPKEYRGATQLYSTTTFPTNNVFGEIKVNKRVTNYSGLFNKITGSVEYPDFCRANRKDILEESFEPTKKEFRKMIKNGGNFNMEDYPQFIKDMIIENTKKRGLAV